MVSSFHLVLISPWPLVFSLVLFNLLMTSLLWFHYSSFMFFFLKVLLLVYVLVLWLSDVEVETWLGYHTLSVYAGLRVGIVLFILSEVMFFFSFFWGFFHSCWRPSLGVVGWPPCGFESVSVEAFGLPLLKTLLLLSSGVSITYCHHSMIVQSKRGVMLGGMVTLVYGFLFLGVQLEEYYLSDLSVNSLVFGTVFFLLTGFHGFHVILGMGMIMYCFFRFLYKKEFSHKQHASFEVAAWYWHFVDVVWLFLYLFVYWYSM